MRRRPIGVNFGDMGDDQPADLRSVHSVAVGRVRRWVRAIVAVAMLLIVAGVMTIALVAWLWPQDFQTPPDTWMGRAYRAAFFARVFQFHAGLGVMVAAIIVLWMRWWRSALLAIACGIALLMPYGREYAPKDHPTVAGPTLRVMAMNLYFRNRDVDAIMAAIDDADPDVIALIEATDWSGKEIIAKRLGKRYPYVDRPYWDAAGITISRVPFRRGTPIPSQLGAPKIPLIFEIGGREVMFFGVHLVSPGADWLVRRNRRQTEEFAEIRRDDPRPMVIAGDFNFTQLTPNYRYLRSLGVRSSHDLAGFGLGNTWGPKWSWMNMLPGMRIDHVMMTPELAATTHRVGLDSGSDHRPVIADIGFANP